MDVYLLIITLLAIVIVILGVSLFKWHAFISLLVASLFLAVCSGMSWDKIASAYETGVGGVLGHLVGILALGTILGKMLAESGAGLQIAEYFIKIFGKKNVPWAMFFSGFIIGIPVFFEVGILILLPLVISIQKATKQKYIIDCIASFSRVIDCTWDCTTASRCYCSDRYLWCQHWKCTFILINYCYSNRNYSWSFICKMDS